MASPKAIASASSSPTAAGAFVDDKNVPVANGYLMLTPTFTSGTLSGGGIISNTPIKITLDSSGIPSAGQSAFMSDQFSSPVNPAFRVRVFNSNDSFVADLGNCVISGSAPVDLTTLTASSNGVTYNGAVLLNPTGQQTINGQNLVMEGAALGFSAAASTTGDVFLDRQAANKAGLGTTASGKDATLLLGKLAAGGTEASGSTAGDITASRSGGTPTTQGVYYLGTDGNGQLFRSGNSVSIAGTSLTWTMPATTDTLAGKATTDNFTNKNLLPAASGNSVTLLNSQDSLGNVTGNGTQQTIYTYTVPANTVQAGKGFRIRCTALSNNAVLVTYQFVVGSTTVASAITNASGVETDQFTIEVFNNSGVQNAQTIIFYATGGTTIIANNTLTCAENFANAITVKITASEANPNTITPKKWFVELIQ